MSPHFHLRSAIVNNNLVYDAQPELKANGQDISAIPFDQGYASELIHYVILQKPVINITDGTNSPFTL